MGLSPQPAVNLHPWIETFPLDFSTNGTTLTANTAYLMRVNVIAPQRVTKMSYAIAASSGNVDLGIYTLSGSTFSRIASSGSVAAGSANTVVDVNLTAAVDLFPGIDYAFAVAADNATINFIRQAPFSVNMGAWKLRFQTKATSFPLPTSLASTSNGNLSLWLVAW